MRDFLLEQYLDHRFDLLGSGWVRWGYGEKARGMGTAPFEGLSVPPDPEGEWLRQVLREEHLEQSKRIWQLLPDVHYEPIDLERDIKSGFRWSAKEWTGDQGKLSAGAKGVDPKVPIELGRMQHLPRMAVLAASTDDPSPYVREFRSQTLDLLAASPPGMGIQWHYSMDVGIRVANICLAYDLFQGMDQDGVLDEPYLGVLSEGVLQHARYIRKNLEYQDGLTGNHYLFNLIGLLFAASYTPPEMEESEEWLAFGVKELIRELFKQFHPDGGNFEGSTAYHRFSTEAMVWGTALILGNKERLQRMGWDERIPLSKWSHGISGNVRSSSKEPLPPEYIERLHRVCRATDQLTKPNGEHPQVGDNDSGRLFRLTPIGRFRSRSEYEELYDGIPIKKEEVFDEEQLEQQTLLSAISGLWKGDGLGRARGNVELEGELVRRFTNGRLLREPEEKGVRFPSVSQRTKQAFRSLPYAERTEIPMDGNFEGEWTMMPRSGWFVHSGPHHFLIVNAPPGKGIRHTWGHVHNDRLSFELYSNGSDRYVDPGSFIYGAFPEERNRFRSTSVHNTLYVEGEEQNRWVAGDRGLFFLLPETCCYLLDHGEQHIELGLKFRKVRQARRFLLEDGALVLEDRSSHPFEVLLNSGVPHSRGYGKKLRTS